MRVIECDECGETLQAADDRELTRILGSHMADEHDNELDEEELAELIETEAYDATDS